VITSKEVRHLRPCEVPGEGCFLPLPIPVDTLLLEVRAVPTGVPVDRS
jgi:hypothetical protein